MDANRAVRFVWREDHPITGSGILDLRKVLPNWKVDRKPPAAATPGVGARLPGRCQSRLFLHTAVAHGTDCI